jgi:ABC-2 type transport system permease protein
MTELTTRALAGLRRSTLWWGVAILVFVGLNLAFWPSLEGSEALAELEKMSDDLLQAFGAQGLATPAGYLDGQLFALMLPLLLSGMVIAGVTAVTSGDEDAGRLELVHVLPVGRTTVWLARFAAALVALACVAAVTGVVVVLLLGPLSFDGVGIGSIAGAVVACTVLAALHGAVGFAAGAAGLTRGRSVALAVAVLVAGYVLDFVVPLADGLRWGRRLSPWWWAIGEQPVSDGVDLGGLVLVLAVSSVLVVAGLLRLTRRDIRTP